MKPTDYTPIPCACGCGVQAVKVRQPGPHRGRYGWAKRGDDCIEISALTWPTTDEAFADGHRYFGRVQ